ALGINRLAVAWTRIEFPNGTTMNLPGYGRGRRCWIRRLRWGGQ
ncbi:conjugation TrbI family protein, partial [Acidithiobacillus sp. GGI-221]